MIVLLLAALAQEGAEAILFEAPTPANALAALDADEPLAARRIALALLAEDPDDFVGNFVVAKVYYHEDANLPRAVYHYRRADRVAERGDADTVENIGTLKCRLLLDLQWVAEDMEDSALFYRTLDRYNDGCTPKRNAERGWRLMKDGRVDEARQVALQGLASDDDWQVALGGNVLCALEAVVRDRAAAVEACEKVVRRSRAAGYDLTVEAYNASTTTLSALDFDRTTELLDVASRGRLGGSTNPWEHYAGYRLLQGKGVEAIDALKKMQRWRLAQDPPERAENRAGADAMVAQVLLGAGEGAAGMRFIDRAIQRPDRRSSTTATAGTTRAAHTLIRLALRRLERAEQAEETATRAFPVRIARWFGSWLPDPDDWNDALAIAGVFTDREVFEGTFAIYHDDGIPVFPWLVGDLIPILGPGVVKAELDRQRNLEVHPGIHAYYDALEAEVDWHRGASDTLDRIDRALLGLPEEEVLLRARLHALGGSSAYADGDKHRAWAHYERALQLDPGALRRLDLPLPAHVEASGGEVAREVAAMLGRSPRITWDPDGFQVTTEDRRVCLASPLGNRLGCVRMPPPPEPDPPAEGEEAAPIVPPDPATSLALAWQKEAFSLQMQLDRQDMQSLDGTTLLQQNARREALESILDAGR